ncbi:MAG: hypothetical protein WCV41_00355 [Patescibacteria group bacterium]
MKKIYQLYRFFFCVVIFATGVAAANSASVIEAGDYFPLKVGLKYIYNVPTVGILEFFEVVGTKNYPYGTGYMFANSCIEPSPYTSYRALGKNKEGAIVLLECAKTMSGEGYKHEPSLIEFLNKSRVGDRVINIYNPGDFSESTLDTRGAIINREMIYFTEEIDGVLQSPVLSFYPYVNIIEIMSTGEKISVPAGIFTDTVKIKYTEVTDDNQTYFKWYAKGVGLIKASGDEFGLDVWNELAFFGTEFPTPTLTPTKTPLPSPTPTNTPTITPTLTATPTLMAESTPTPAVVPYSTSNVIYKNDIKVGSLTDNGIIEIAGTFSGLAPAQISVNPGTDKNYLLCLRAEKGSGSLLFFSLSQPLEISPDEEVRVSVTAAGDKSSQIFIGAIDVDSDNRCTPVMEYITTFPLAQWEKIETSHQSRSGRVVPIIQIVGPGTVYIDSIEVRTVKKQSF